MLCVANAGWEVRDLVAQETQSPVLVPVPVPVYYIRSAACAAAERQLVLRRFALRLLMHDQPVESYQYGSRIPKVTKGQL